METRFELWDQPEVRQIRVLLAIDVDDAESDEAAV
jgi:hypothetical protein